MRDKQTPEVRNISAKQAYVACLHRVVVKKGNACFDVYFRLTEQRHPQPSHLNCLCIDCVPVSGTLASCLAVCCLASSLVPQTRRLAAGHAVAGSAFAEIAVVLAADAFRVHCAYSGGVTIPHTIRLVLGGLLSSIVAGPSEKGTLYGRSFRPRRNRRSPRRRRARRLPRQWCSSCGGQWDAPRRSPLQRWQR